MALLIIAYSERDKREILFRPPHHRDDAVEGSGLRTFGVASRSGMDLVRVWSCRVGLMILELQLFARTSRWADQCGWVELFPSPCRRWHAATSRQDSADRAC